MNKIILLGLDPEYIEYLKSKKQKALDAEQAMTDEQKQSKIIVDEYSMVWRKIILCLFLVHYALEEMKKSLSFISSKLVTKESRGNLRT